MIRVAKECKADAVKFQLFDANRIVNPYSSFNRKTGKKLGVSTVAELYNRLKMPREYVRDLVKYSKELNIEFLVTPFDREAVDLLVSEGISAIKIASYEITDVSFLEYCGKTGLPIIISTGIALEADIKKAIKTIKATGSWVKEKNYQMDNDRNLFSFYMKDYKGTELKVLYRGAMPNNFESSISVVVTGKYQNGVFHASDILTKCPSKYESEYEQQSKS